MNTRIKFSLVLILIMLGCIQLNAQQDPQFTQYYFNPLALNPAYAGTRDALSINILAREQWLGIDGRPRTQTISMHAPIADSHISWGASFIADQHGPIKSTYINLDGAYKTEVNEKSMLSLGLRTSLHLYRANFSSLEASGDVSFLQDVSATTLPNFGFSAYWYSQNHFIGLSVPKLIENSISTELSSIEAPLEKRHYFLTAGKVFTLNESLKLKPTLLLKHVSSAPLSIDASVNLLIREKLWVGTFLRLKDALGMMVSYQLNENLRFGYSYDKTTSILSGFNQGSHELLINYDLKLGSDKTLSPRYF